MIVACDGKNYDVTEAESLEEHLFVRRLLNDADAGSAWRKEDLQRVANLALLARPLAVRLKQIQSTEGSLV